VSSSIFDPIQQREQDGAPCPFARVRGPGKAVLRNGVRARGAFLFKIRAPNREDGLP